MKIRQCSNITEAVVFGLKMIKFLKKINNEAEEMAQWLRVQAVLAEISSLVPRST